MRAGWRKTILLTIKLVIPVKRSASRDLVPDLEAFDITLFLHEILDTDSRRFRDDVILWRLILGFFGRNQTGFVTQFTASPVVPK